MVVKSSVRFDDQGEPHGTDAAPIRARDVHRDGNPAHSLEDASDLFPFLPRGEVLFCGEAWGPSGVRCPARLAIVSGGRVVVDKRLEAQIPPSGAATGSIAITYESSLGGPGYPFNPVGREDPPLVHATAPKFPAALGPIARGWKLRSSLLSKEDKAALKAAEPALSDGFNYAFFHSAPPDQRVAGFFRGDETIRLESLVRGGGARELVLPSMRARAKRLLPTGHEQDIPLVLDTLRVDGASDVVSATFRGAIVLGEEEEPIVVSAAVALFDQPFVWPDVSAGADFVDEDTAATRAVRLDELGSRTMPFSGADAERGHDETRASAPLPGAPWSGASAFATPAERRQAMTIQEGMPAPSSPPIGPFPLPPARAQDQAPAADAGEVELEEGPATDLLLVMAEKLRGR